MERDAARDFEVRVIAKRGGVVNIADAASISVRVSDVETATYPSTNPRQLLLLNHQHVLTCSRRLLLHHREDSHFYCLDIAGN